MRSATVVTPLDTPVRLHGDAGEPSFVGQVVDASLMAVARESVNYGERHWLEERMVSRVRGAVLEQGPKHMVIEGLNGRRVTLDLARLLSVRQRVIGALLRQERNEANLSVKDTAERTGIPTHRIKAYELGERPIPLPELEVILSALGGRVEDFFDKNGPVGRWLLSQGLVQSFLELPEEMRNFVSQPVNRPYLELAMKLSEMSKDRLRSVAEGLLDITL